MAGGGGGSPQVVEYDPSVKDAELQMMKGQLTDKVTKQAYSLQRNANVYADQALDALNDGLGLLSNYLDTQVANSRRGLALSEQAYGSAQELHTRAKAGADMIVGSGLSFMEQAAQADKAAYGGK